MAISKNDPEKLSKSDPTVQHQQPENPAPGITQGGGAPNLPPENAPEGARNERLTGADRVAQGDAPRTQLDQERVRENARLGEMRHRAEQAKRKAEESRHLADKAAEEAKRLAIRASADAEEAQRLASAADPEKAVYLVAEGKSLFTLSGTLGAFQRVKARDFAGGAAELEEQVRAGNVVLKS